MKDSSIPSFISFICTTNRKTACSTALEAASPTTAPIVMDRNSPDAAAALSSGSMTAWRAMNVALCAIPVPIPLCRVSI